MLRFYAAPLKSANTDELTAKTLDHVHACKTRLIIIDDFHFLKPRRRDGRDISDHVKHIANEFPVTIIFIGVGLTERGVFSEDTYSTDQALAQTLRRVSLLRVEPFTTKKKTDRQAWHDLLVAIENRLLLARKHPGMLSEELSDYLYVRSTGHIGSLMSLICQGCEEAMRSGTETLTRQLLNTIALDIAAEAARQALQSEFDSGRKTMRIDATV